MHISAGQTYFNCILQKFYGVKRLFRVLSSSSLVVSANTRCGPCLQVSHLQPGASKQEALYGSTLAHSSKCAEEWGSAEERERPLPEPRAVGRLAAGSGCWCSGSYRRKWNGEWNLLLTLLFNSPTIALFKYIFQDLTNTHLEQEKYSLQKRRIWFADSGMESEIAHSPFQFPHIAFYLLPAPLHIGSDLHRYLHSTKLWCWHFCW